MTKAMFVQMSMYNDDVFSPRLWDRVDITPGSNQ